jgi:hypothetical protein
MSGFDIENLEQAAAAGGGPRRRHHDHDDLAHRSLQDGEVEHERGHHAGGHRAGRDLVAAVPEHRALGGVEGERGGADRGHPQLDPLVGLAQRLGGRAVELAEFEIAGGEGAHHPDALQFLFHCQGQDAHQRLHPHPGDPQQKSDAAEGDDAERHERQRQ